MLIELFLENNLWDDVDFTYYFFYKFGSNFDLFIHNFSQYFETANEFKKKFAFEHVKRLFHVFRNLLEREVITVIDEIASKIYNVRFTAIYTISQINLLFNIHITRKILFASFRIVPSVKLFTLPLFLCSRVYFSLAPVRLAIRNKCLATHRLFVTNCRFKGRFHFWTGRIHQGSVLSDWICEQVPVDGFNYEKGGQI